MEIWILKMHHTTVSLLYKRIMINNCKVKRIKGGYLTIIPQARMGSESITHEAEGRMGY